jgi:flagellar basal-body rod protein FlgB
MATPFGGVEIVNLLQNGMRVAEYNQKLIANNVANADTPRFNSVELDFQKTLKASIEGRVQFSLRKTDARHLESNSYQPVMKRVAPLSKNDYNKVDLDEEMVKLSDNSGKYTLYSRLLVKHFQQTRTMLSNLR